MGDVTWLGNRTILYDGHVLGLRDTNDGWEAMNAINEYERRKREEIAKAVREETAKANGTVERTGWPIEHLGFMICSRCKNQIFGRDNYCRVCGCKLAWEDAGEKG